MGAQHLLHGVFQGVTGVISAPITGARRQGFKGLVKGVGVGVAGLVVKPLTGLADFTSKTLEDRKSVV